LHDMGAGLTGTEKKDAHGRRLATALDVLYCPTRRAAILYPYTTGLGTVNATSMPAVGRTDYAGNGGDYYTTPGWPTSPAWGASYVNVDGGPADVTQIENPPGTMTDGARTTFANVARNATGIFFCGSLIKMADITDGASNTYLLGEKYLNPDLYTTGADPTDNESAFIGENADISRWFGYPGVTWLPTPDTPGNSACWGFGSAHTSVVNMAFCDGSVQPINFLIDIETHRRMCSRNDGLAVDPKMLE
jgi:prepilin-type processing-associated H-X9-DG protein